MFVALNVKYISIFQSMKRVDCNLVLLKASWQVMMNNLKYLNDITFKKKNIIFNNNVTFDKIMFCE